MRYMLIFAMLLSTASAQDFSMVADRPQIMAEMQLTTATSFQMLGSVEPKSLPLMFAYYRDNCDACDLAKLQLASETNLPFRVVWIKGGPSWLEGWPTFWWHRSQDNPTQEDVVNTKQLAGWFGTKDLVGRWTSTRQVSVSNLGVEGASAPTPGREVERVLNLLPPPQVGFVDFGCGDARWCIAAVERWGCRATGVEIDPIRAKAAKDRVASLGLSHLITIIEGDAATVTVTADVGVAYLYADVLEQLLPKIKKLKAFASYQHRPPGLPVVKNGDTWLYQQQAVQASQGSAAVWQGQYYSSPVCNSPNCSMCRSIRQQLGFSR